MADVLTVIDLGQRVKAKYPEYAGIQDAELGRRIKVKYPEYGHFADIGPAHAAATPLGAPAGQPPAPQVEQPSILQRLAGAAAPVAEAAQDFAVAKPGERIPSVPSAPVAIPPTAEAARSIESPLQFLQSTAAINLSGLVSRDPQIIPELTGPPAPLPERPQMMSLGEGPPIPVLQTREQMQIQGAESERTARAVAREILGMINPVNAALVAASGGAAVVVRGIANSPKVVALLQNTPAALRLLDIIGESVIPATFAGISGKQAKDQITASREAYEQGDVQAGQEHAIGALTSLMIAAGASVATGVRVKGAVAGQPPVKGPAPARLPSLRAQQARESATRAKSKAAELKETGRGAAAELQIRKAKTATTEAQEIGTQQWAKVFGEATPKTLDGKPVRAKLAGVSKKGRPIYELRDESGKVIYSGSATEVSTRLRYEGPKAAAVESAEQLSAAARSLRAKRQQQLELEAEIPKGYTRDKGGFLRDESGKVVLPGDVQVRFGAQKKWKPGDPIPKTGIEATGTEVLPTRPAIEAPAPAKTPAAKKAASIVEGLREQAAKATAPAPTPKPLAAPKEVPAPAPKAPTAKVAVAPAPVVPAVEKKEPIVSTAKFKINRKAIKGPMQLEVEQGIADRLFDGKTRVDITIDEDGAIQATPVGGGEEHWIAFASDKVISGYRLPPREAAQKAPAEKKVASKTASTVEVAVAPTAPREKGKPTQGRGTRTERARSAQVDRAIKKAESEFKGEEFGSLPMKLRRLRETRKLLRDPSITGQGRENLEEVERGYFADADINRALDLPKSKELPPLGEAAQQAPAEKKVAKRKKKQAVPVTEAPALAVEAEKTAAEPTVAATEKVAPTERPDWIPKEAVMGPLGWELDINKYDVEPEVYQFRSQPFGPSGIVDDRLAKIKVWDRSKEPNILLWVNPKDMRTKLIQGHHQTDAGKRLDVGMIRPQFIPWDIAPTPEKARLFGVISNLREGHVNAVDVARFMRDTGASNIERLQEEGIAAKGKVFQDGQALSRLDAAIFQEVALGRLRERYAVAAGQASGEAFEQKKIVEVLQKREDRTGGPVDAKLALRIADRVAQADTTTETEATLFGTMETRASLFEQEAEIAEHISKQLGREKRLFSTVSASVSAGTLEATGNVLKREENLARAKQLTRGKETFEKLSGKAGPIDQIIKKHAKRLAEGEGQNAATIRREAYQEIVAELGKGITGRDAKSGKVSGRSEGARSPSEQTTVALAESEQVILYSGIPAIKEIIDIGIRKTTSDLGILKAEGMKAQGDITDWVKESRKEPNWLFWGAHLPAYIADVMPAFKPIFDLAREGHHKAVEHIAEFMDLSEDYWKLSSGQARLLNERLIDADRKGVPGIEEDGLEPKTMNAFRGFRRAMDHAFRLMEDLTVDLATQGKVTSAATIRSKKNMFDALIEGDMNEAQANKRAELVWETLEKFRESRRTGYVPHSRLGKWHYGLKVAETQEPIHYGSKPFYRSAANKMRELRSEHAAKLKSGEYELMNEEGRPWKKYQQSFGELISDFMDSQLLKELSPELAEEVRNEIEPLLGKTGAKAKFLSRKNIPGYDTDIHRVAADYFLMVGHFVARTRMFRDMRDKMPKESKSRPRLPKYAKDYVRYLARPDNTLAWLRSLMFHYHLGFLNPKAAGFNLTQVPLVTFPWLLQYAKAPAVLKEITRAYADLKKPTPDDPMGRGKIEYARLPEDVREAAIASLHHGTLAAQYARELGGIQKRGFSRTGVVAKLGTLADFGEEASSFLFQGAEHVNRLVTFIAAYRLGKKNLPKGFKDASEFAESVVDNTQFQYAKYNRPKFSWPKGFNILAMFKTFSLAHYEVMLRLALGTGAGGDGPPDPEREERNRIALAAFTWMIVISSGIYGLPFMGTLKAGFEKLHKLFTGTEIDLDTVFDRVTEKFHLRQIAEFMLWGATRFSPVDLTDLGNDPVSGEYVLRSGDPTELVAVRGTARRLTEGVRRLARGEPRAVEYLAPTAVRGFMKMYREVKGEPTLLSRSENPLPFPLLPGRTEEESRKLTLGETVLTGLGFPLTRVAKAYENIRRVYNLAHGAADLKDSVIKETVRTINRPDVTEDQINASIDKVLAFNEVFPEQAITQEGISTRITNRNMAPWQRVIQQTPEPARLGVMKILRPDLFEKK